MKTKNSVLEELRKSRGFLSLTAFCRHYNEVTGENMGVGALSSYELFGKSPKHTSRVSQARFDSLKKVLELDSEEEASLRKFFKVTRKNPLRKMTPHNHHNMVKERAKSKRKSTEKISRRGGKRNQITKLRVNKENSPKTKTSKDVKNYVLLAEHLKTLLGTKMQNKKVKNLTFELSLYM